MSRPSVLLALDSGSQSSRALLFDRDGGVLAKGAVPHGPMRHPELGAVEQDPVDIRDALFEAIRCCLAAWGGDPAEIAGASLTTQRNTLLPVGTDGEPLSDAVSWLDRRVASPASEPSGLVRGVLRLLGDRAMVSRLLAKSQPRIWRERRPEILKRLRWVAPIEAWLHHQLTGEMAMAPGGMAGVVPTDLPGRGWSKTMLLHRLLGFEPRWLPRIVEAGREVGRIRPEVADATGLPEGLPLFSCGGDKQAETLGGGVRLTERGVAAVSMGTAASIMLPWSTAKQSSRYHWITLCSAEPDSWQLEYMVFRGMWTAGWFARNLGGDLAERAKAEDSLSYWAQVYCAPSQATNAISLGVSSARLARAWTTVGQSGRRPPCAAMRSSRLRLRQRFRALIVTAARPTPPHTAAVVLRRLLGMVCSRKHSPWFLALCATASRFWPASSRAIDARVFWQDLLYVLAAQIAPPKLHEPEEQDCSLSSVLQR